ncbi:MAG: aminoglycoside phosphotransferase family protein [Thermomicrobiales bacterium]
MGYLSERKQVQRTGNVTLRPSTPWTATIHALLRHLETVGFSGAPRIVGTGVDPTGRETVEFIAGEVVPQRVWSDEGIFDLGQLLNRLHQATASFRPPLDAVWQDSFLRATGPNAIVSHGDAAPWNVVARHGRPVALIDWELAGPVDRLRELAHTGWLNAQLFDDDVAERQGLPPVEDRVRQLRLFADGYQLPATDRAELVTRLIDVAILSSASDAIEAKITPDSTGADWLVWGVVWRARSAAWLVRHRSLLEQALR